jgi:peptide deformylase
MTVLSILEYPDPRLRQRALAVAIFDAALRRLVEDLLDTLYAKGGIGLSAPQVGAPWQVAVADLSGSRSAPRVYVNPEILTRSRPAIVEESCLSVPGVVGKVLRSTRLRVRARDATGASFEQDLADMDAVCLQHEVDHLIGKLFIDRLSPLRRLRLWAAARRVPAARHATPT